MWLKWLRIIFNDTLYFSRYPIPFNREDAQIDYYKRIGIYGYTKVFLKKYVELPETKLENWNNYGSLRMDTKLECMKHCMKD